MIRCTVLLANFGNITKFILLSSCFVCLKRISKHFCFVLDSSEDDDFFDAEDENSIIEEDDEEEEEDESVTPVNQREIADLQTSGERQAINLNRNVVYLPCNVKTRLYLKMPLSVVKYLRIGSDYCS